MEVERKAIKNLHLGVYPPHGRVRVAAPMILDIDAIRMAVIGKLGWIKRQKAKFAHQPRQSKREMVSGESHYFLGRRYRLRVREHDAVPKVALRGVSSLDLYVRPGSNREKREAVLAAWYRDQLRELIAPLLEKWEPKLQVKASAWGIKKMKTLWGSCNPSIGRIWFNLELAKTPVQCLEYIVVHELLHLIERHHNEHFAKLLDAHLPQWREARQLLQSIPLGHEEWNH